MLPRVGTMKEMSDYLDDAINPPKGDGEEPRGRIRELKTFVLESDGGFTPQFEAGGIRYEVHDTGMGRMKILLAHGRGGTCRFFLDTRDKRYLLLHTTDRSDDARGAINALATDHDHEFDHTWFYSDLLKKFGSSAGNTFKGFGVAYSNKFVAPEDAGDCDIEDLHLSISGTLARDIQDLVETKPGVLRTMAYNKIRVMRRSSDPGLPRTDFVQDDIDNTGYFAVKRGKSIDDHFALVDICRDEYSGVVRDVESRRIGTRDADGRALVGGSPFHILFPNEIDDLDAFVGRMFNSAEPFRLWGTKSKIRDGYLKVMAVDLHTGRPIDFEITSDMMRVYLFKGNCGNTLMRLLTNVQMYYDSKAACHELS